MKNHANRSIGQIVYRWRFFHLLVLILLMLIVVPLTERYAQLHVTLDIFFTLIFIAAWYAFYRSRLHIIVAVTLALPMLISLWSSYLIQSPLITVGGKICGILFILFIIIGIIEYIFAQKEITLDLIIGATVVYLLMAVMWAFVYSVIEQLAPQSLIIPIDKSGHSTYNFLYYSFITLTTVGFGDITPRSNLASSFTVLEAVIGQLYLVVMVAWLVGMHVSQKAK